MASRSDSPPSPTKSAPRSSSLRRKGASKDATPRKAVVEDAMLLSAVTSYFKKAVIVMAVWASGYYTFSPSWVLLALVAYVWKERQNAAKKHKIAIAQEITRDEKEVILARVEDLPSWVYFPDVERAEWVNKMILQMWPYVGEYVRKLLQESIEPKIRASLPPTLGSFKFSKIDIGDMPPRIGGIKVYTTDVRRDEILMDLEINYASDSNISVQVKGVNAGIKDLTLRGTMRIIFRPLITKVPLIGGMSVFFLNNPEIDFNLTSLANAFDLPMLNDMLHSIIAEQIAALMVLPNRIPIQMASDVDIQKLRYPQPQGVLRVFVVEARDLIKADIGITGKGKSDPYTIVTVGARSERTKVIDNTVEPVWNAVFEFIIDERDGQIMTLELKDKDPGNKDDHLGSTTVDIQTVFESGTIDEWLPLTDVKKGMVHIKATWLYLANDPLELDRVVEQVRESGQDENAIHSALLLVNLDSAIDLPRGKKTLMEPSPHVFLTVGQTTEESATRANTCDPKWETNYRFFVTNPSHQSLDVEVRDSRTKKTLGETSIRLKELLGAENMIRDQKFKLKGGEPSTCIYMTLVLRILTPEANPDWLVSEHGSPFVDTDVVPEGTSVDGVDGVAQDKKSGNAESSSSGTSQPAPGKASNGGKPGSASPAKEQTIKPATAAGNTDSELRQRKPTSSVNGGSIDDSGANGLGRIQLTFRYSLQRQRLVVVIHKITNLKPAERDSKGLADPYVKMYLLPDRDSKSKRKTDVVKDNLNPVFDETFEYPVNLNELTNRTLELSVKNETGIFSSSQTMLGMVLVDLSTLDTSRAVTQWFDLAPQASTKASSLESDV